MEPVHPILYPLSLLWKTPAPFVHGKKFFRSFIDRQAVFMDPVPVLFYYFCKTGRGRNSARRQRNAPVYGGYFHRLDSSRVFSVFLIRPDEKFHRHMVRMAGWMDNRHDNFHFLLPQGMQQISLQ